MSAQFKVGEIAIFQNAMFNLSINGQEVEIIGGLHEYIGEVTGLRRQGYRIRLPCGRASNALPHQLRKKNPPSTGEQAIMALFNNVASRKRVPV